MMMLSDSGEPGCRYANALSSTLSLMAHHGDPARFKRKRSSRHSKSYREMKAPPVRSFLAELLALVSSVGGYLPALGLRTIRGANAIGRALGLVTYKVRMDVFSMGIMHYPFASHMVWFLLVCTGISTGLHCASLQSIGVRTADCWSWAELSLFFIQVKPCTTVSSNPLRPRPHLHPGEVNLKTVEVPFPEAYSR